MLYTGLRNISLADLAYLTIPMQNILLHYKTETGRDTLVSSSFLMLMGFNDTSNTMHPDSPDRNDTLWASFSFGLNLRQIFPNATFPSLNSKSVAYPLTQSDDGLTWKWGMKYTNLTALWVTTFIKGNNQTDTTKPWGLATYDELSFNYTLTIDPENHKATISQDHVIGRMRDLWTFWGWFIVPLYNHYNYTGCYRYGAKVSNETIYQFLERNKVKMSIVDFQTSVMLERNTYCTAENGENVTDNEVLVTDSTITTYADDGEKIFDAAFGVKEYYDLFNYTEDETESTSVTHRAISRTAQISGYARNKNLFQHHSNFAKFLPLVLAHMYPQLFQRAKETIANMTRADYLYLISYPNYSGYRIEHDPIYTIYFAPAIPPSGVGLGGFLLVLVIVVTLVTVAIIVLRRKKPKAPTQSPTTTGQPLPPPPPTI